jgi:glycosyltransferase involved in cell wall biosynthesis
VITGGVKRTVAHLVAAVHSMAYAARRTGDRRDLLKQLVALNGRYTGVEKPTGVQTVAHELFRHLVVADRPFGLIIFADTTMPGIAEWTDATDVELVHVPFRTWGRGRSQLFEQVRLTARARSMGADLIYHPINTCPRFGAALPQVVTLMDLNFHHNPQWYGRAFRTWLEHTTVPGLRKADQVVCISDWVAEDARRTLGLDAGRVRKIYCGLRRLDPNEGTGSQDDVVLAVNPFQPHKNLIRIVDAVETLREERPGLQLRVAGRPQGNFRQNPGLGERLERDFVHVTGYLTDVELADEYRRAAVLCMPSFEEGFGMPVIEAMSLDTTVVTSDRSCMPEVAGEAGIFVDPASTAAITDGLRLALGESRGQREHRHRLGREHAARFDWVQIADQYIELFSEVLSS